MDSLFGTAPLSKKLLQLPIALLIECQLLELIEHILIFAVVESGDDLLFFAIDGNGIDGVERLLDHHVLDAVETLLELVGLARFGGVAVEIVKDHFLIIFNMII